jgi:hypothetical protein
MIKTLRNIAAVGLAALGFALPASATTYSIDYSDLWYANPPESEAGWGINLSQQNEVLFGTMFIYGADQKPTWYVASNMSPTGNNAFGGPLYSFTGSYFGAPWTGVTPPNQVGNINVVFNTATTGTLTYNVGGVVVTKNIIRQTWRLDNLTGPYVGGTVALGTQCGGNGGILINGELTINHAGPTITMTVDFFNASGQDGTCTYNGTYSQVGSMGAVNNGSYTCKIGGVQNAVTGNFSISELVNSRNGINGRIAGTTQFCSYAGFFGGVRDVFTH